MVETQLCKLRGTSDAFAEYGFSLEYVDTMVGINASHCQMANGVVMKNASGSAGVNRFTAVFFRSQPVFG